MSGLDTFLLFIGEIISIYFLSRLALQNAYRVLQHLRNRQLVIGIISFLYEPGTVVHELSHYFVALILNMHPSEISIFPVIEKNNIRLGHVLYQKNKGDFIRPVLVGIAPIFGAMAILVFIVLFKLFPGKELWQTALFGYLILAITANMFSSPQDLVDIIYIIPLVIIAAILLYLFPIAIHAHYITLVSNTILIFIRTIQPALLFSIAFHAILVLSLSRLK